MNKLLKTQSAPRIIAGGFALVIFIGSLLLMLPCSIQPGTHLDYIDARHLPVPSVSAGLTVVVAGVPSRAIFSWLRWSIERLSASIGAGRLAMGRRISLKGDAHS
ncbi:MAG: hypothetical protein ACLTSO_09115 [Coprococcus sp.]